jgi:hypothetical protein
VNFLNGKPYIFTSYINLDTNKLIRHFIKSQISNQYSGHFYSLIPINQRMFWKPVFWQNALLKKTNNEYYNSCLINMLSSTSLKQLGNDCKYEKSARVKFAENIYGISHYFG